MEISSVEILSIHVSGLCHDCEGIQHVKTLPVLSVVQSLEGSYEVSLDGGSTVFTGEGGAFIAPAAALQQITHHNGARGVMKAQWVFLKVQLNQAYALDDVYDLPALIPPEHCAEVRRMIEDMADPMPICTRYAAAYRLTGLLMELGTLRPKVDAVMMQMRSYISEHCGEHITAADLARHIPCSVSQVFRYSRRFFSQSPANYINSIRLSRAASLLESTDLEIGAIALQSGFSDMAYFSRLFRRHFGVSPRDYRRAIRAAQNNPG